MLSKQLNEKIINDLYLKIPEFKDYVIKYTDEECLTGYLILDDFGDFVKDLIRQNALQELIDRCYSFINLVCENDDKEIKEWLKVTFLESMIDEGKPREVTKLKLKGKALIFFEEILSHPFFGG